MTDTRLGGAAMIAAAVAGILVMAVHPTSHTVLAPDKFPLVAVIGEAVHIFAIITAPVAFLGALALTRHLDSPNRLAMAALAIYGFALVAIVSAATFSGLVTIPILQTIVEQPQSAAQWEGFARYSGIVNQGFARIYAILESISIALWSVQIVRTRMLPPAAGIYGLVIAPVIFIAVASGHVRLDVHGFGAVVLLQGIWLIAVGAALYRTRLVPSPSGS
jgi:hypothetical protein